MHAEVLVHKFRHPDRLSWKIRTFTFDVFCSPLLCSYTEETATAYQSVIMALTVPFGAQQYQHYTLTELVNDVDAELVFGDEPFPSHPLLSLVAMLLSPVFVFVR